MNSAVEPVSLVAREQTVPVQARVNSPQAARSESEAKEFASVAEGIAQAHAALVPAEAAWAVVDAPNHTHCRRWIRQERLRPRR